MLDQFGFPQTNLFTGSSRDAAALVGRFERGDITTPSAILAAWLVLGVPYEEATKLAAGAMTAQDAAFKAERKKMQDMLDKETAELEEKLSAIRGKKFELSAAMQNLTSIEAFASATASDVAYVLNGLAAPKRHAKIKTIIEDRLRKAAASQAIVAEATSAAENP